MNYRVGQLWVAYFDLINRQKHVTYVVVNTRAPTNEAEAHRSKSYHTIAVIDCYDSALVGVTTEEPEVLDWGGLTRSREGAMSDRTGQTWVQRWRHTDYYVVLGEGRPYSSNPEKPEPTYMLLDLQTGTIDRVKQSALDDDEDIQIWQRIA